MTPPKGNHNAHRPLTEARMEELLSEQTAVILTAVDTRLEKLERRWLEKLNQLTTTLDKFLKRMSDLDDELTFLKNDLKRVKAVIREKLGVILD